MANVDSLIVVRPNVEYVSPSNIARETLQLKYLNITSGVLGVWGMECLGGV